MQHDLDPKMNSGRSLNSMPDYLVLASGLFNQSCAKCSLAVAERSYGTPWNLGAKKTLLPFASENQVPESHQYLPLTLRWNQVDLIFKSSGGPVGASFEGRSKNVLPILFVCVTCSTFSSPFSGPWEGALHCAFFTCLHYDF
jgi:hypothetical protein